MAATMSTSQAKLGDFAQFDDPLFIENPGGDEEPKSIPLVYVPPLLLQYKPGVSIGANETGSADAQHRFMNTPARKAFLSRETSLLRVADSHIRHAGVGAFAKRNIEEGTHIVLYAGVRKSTALLKKQVPGDKLGQYWAQIDETGVYIDATDPDYSNISRAINHCKLEDKKKGWCNGYNVKFAVAYDPMFPQEYKKGQESAKIPTNSSKSLRATMHADLWIVATRDIAAGEELFMDYGPDYFSEAAPVPIVVKSTVTKPTYFDPQDKKTESPVNHQLRTGGKIHPAVVVAARQKRQKMGVSSRSGKRAASEDSEGSETEYDDDQEQSKEMKKKKKRKKCGAAPGSKRENQHTRRERVAEGQGRQMAPDPQLFKGKNVENKNFLIRMLLAYPTESLSMTDITDGNLSHIHTAIAPGKFQPNSLMRAPMDRLASWGFVKKTDTGGKFVLYKATDELKRQAAAQYFKLGIRMPKDLLTGVTPDNTHHGSRSSGSNDNFSDRAVVNANAAAAVVTARANALKSQKQGNSKKSAAPFSAEELSPFSEGRPDGGGFMTEAQLNSIGSSGAEGELNFEQQ